MLDVIKNRARREFLRIWKLNRRLTGILQVAFCRWELSQIFCFIIFQFEKFILEEASETMTIFSTGFEPFIECKLCSRSK